MIVEILSAVCGSSLISTVVMSILYYSSNKRMKDAEVSSQEAEAQLKKIEAKIARNDGEHKAREQLHDVISELNNQMKDVIISSGDQVDIINKQLTDEMASKAEITARLRQYQDELLITKNEQIKLVQENSELRMELAHCKNWLCERDFEDCKRRKPEQKIKCPYHLFHTSYENH